MELLAQCSRALYNEDLLDAKKRMAVLEKENKLLIVPRVHYKNKETWSRAVNRFTKEVDDYILNTNEMRGRFPGVKLDIYLQELLSVYTYELNKLMKGLSPLWCKVKSEALIRVIRLGFSGIGSIRHRGHGSYPFTNWRIDEYRYFILGLKQYFENGYENHLYCQKHGWVGQIPYYHCTHCNKRIEGTCVMLALQRYDIHQRCIPCIKNVLKSIKRIQAMWRGWIIRNAL